MSTHGGTSTSAPPATTVTGPDAIGAPAVVGTGLHYARNDHDHGLPILDYNAEQYNDLLGWTYDPKDINGTTTALPAAATLYLCRIPLPGVLTVTNLSMWITALGLVLTHSFLALYKSDGTVIGQTADQSAVWGTGGSTGYKTLALAGGPFVCTPLAANDFVWAAAYVGTSTGALPTLVNQAASGFTNVGTVTARSRVANIAQTDRATLGTINPAALVTQNYFYWFGLS
jgi:hypothetical protein